MKSVFALCCAITAAGFRGINPNFMFARSGIITGTGGSNTALVNEISQSDPRTATLGTVAIDVLKSDLVGDEKAVVIQLGTVERSVSMAAPATVASALTTFLGANAELELIGAFSKDDPTEVSSAWTADGINEFNGSEAIEVPTLTAKPVRTVGSMVAAIEDALTAAEVLDAIIIINQSTEDIKVYSNQSATPLTAFRTTIAGEAEFTQTLPEAAAAEDRLFGE